VFQREARECLEFLGRQKFVQHHALRRQPGRPRGNGGAGF
jgi:hypothetical protein